MKIPDIKNSESIDWQYKNSINIAGKELPVKSLNTVPGSGSENECRSEFYLINNNILSIITYGAPSREDIKYGIKKTQKLLNKFGRKKYYLVWDISAVKRLNAKVRREIEVGNKFLREWFHHQFLIISDSNKTLFKLYQLVNPERSLHTSMALSIDIALEHIVNQSSPQLNNQQFYTKPHLSKGELLKLSKEELADKIVDMELHHKEKTLQIFEALGKISWDKNFSPVTIDVDEDDPYIELIKAINLLQEDVHEIVSDLMYLNQNLEFKVAERIIDIIDKESNLRAILDNSDSQVWLLNCRYELIEFNNQFIKEFSKINGVTPEVNQNILKLVENEEEREKWQQRYEHALAGKPGIYLDEVISDGVEKIMEVKTFPINEVGNIKGISVFVKDITELKRSELKLIQKNRALEKVNSELDSFVYRVSHDLRAPLTSILGLINLLKIEKDTDKQNYYIDLQAKSVTKLDNFIQDIINLSRNSRQEIQIEPIELKNLVKYIFEDQHYSAYSNIIEKRVNIKQQNHFYTDKRRLGIVLNNLISNGIKYCNPNQDVPYISINAEVDEDKAIIEIQDNGIGIAENHLNKIFTMFYRANQDNSGSGLGLYIVKETVDKLFGTISVKSNMRRGSTFTITLPNLKEMSNMP